MAYLAKHKIGGKTYYYVAENIRLGPGKRKQIRKFIGTENPSESKLENIIQDFEKELEKRNLSNNGTHYLPKEEINEVDKINTAFWRRYKSQNKTVQEQFDQNFVNTFVFNSNSIEGSTLTPKEVELLLEENIAPNKDLNDVLEAKSAERALKFVKEYEGELNETFVKQVHEIYFKETKPFIAGFYKTRQNRITGSGFETTPPKFIPADMKNLFFDYEKNKKEMHPLELATWIQWKLVRIHPFQDGNGRTARILMNYILHKNGYAMIDIKTKEKKQYFKTLEQCNKTNNARLLAIRLARRFQKQYQNALKE